MQVTLRACALIATTLGFTTLCWAVALRAQEAPPSTEPAVRAAPERNYSPPPRPLTELPEVRVVGAPAGVGAPGGVNSSSTPVSGAVLGGSSLGETGSSVTVITAEQIQQRRQTSVVEMLRGIPGVNIAQAGGPGQTASVFIRGSASEQTKVIIDGIWANDPVTVGRTFDLATLSIDNIERIEVIRGPQSTLFGSDAIGGVINIITKKGKGPRSGSVSGMGGSFNTSREAGAISGGNDKVHYSAGLSYFNNTGFSNADSQLPGNPLPNGFSNGNLSTRMGWTPTDNFDVEFILRYIRSDTQIDNGGGPFMDRPNAWISNDQMFTRTQLHYRGDEEIWDQWLSYNTSNQTRDTGIPIFGADPVNPFNSTFQHTNGETRMVEWRHALRLHRTNKLVFGASYYHEEGSSDLFITFDAFFPPFVNTHFASPFASSTPRQSLTDRAVYVQDQITLGERWFTTVGVRQDNYSLAGTATTYRVTSLYKVPVTNTSVRATVGTGFKAPSIFQLNDTLNGNPNLKPEESLGYDFGFDQPFFNNRVVVGATYFRNQYTNLIQLASVGIFGSNYFNVGRAASAGLELTGLYNINDLTALTGTYTKLDTVNESTGVALLRQPQDMASIGVNRKVFDRRGNVNMNVVYVGARSDVFFPDGFTSTPARLDPYVVANLAASYDLTPKVQLFGRIDNLTDTRYEQLFGYGTAPFSGYAGLSKRW